MAGMGSLLSPCVVPLIPSYLTAMAGGKITETVDSQLRARVITNALAFILGFTIILVLSGMAATQIGVFLHANQRLIAKIGGIIIMIFALQVLGVININFLSREQRISMNTKSSKRLVGAVFLGIAFAAGWTPCVGPVWASILIMASHAHSVVIGGALLLVYAMGMALPLLLLAIFIGQALKTVNRIKPYLMWIERVTGVLLFLLGLALTTGFYSQIPGLLQQL